MNVRRLKIFRSVHVHMTLDRTDQKRYPARSFFQVLRYSLGTQQVFNPIDNMRKGFFTYATPYFLQVFTGKPCLQKSFTDLLTFRKACIVKPVYDLIFPFHTLKSAESWPGGKLF